MRQVLVVERTECWGRWAQGITYRVEGDIHEVESIAIHDAVGGETRCDVHSIKSLLEKKVQF